MHSRRGFFVGLLGLFKDTILSHSFLTPSNIFRLASGSALLLPCSPGIPASPFFHPSDQRKEITAMKLNSAVLWFISCQKFGSSRKSSSRFANTQTTPHHPIPSQNLGRATVLPLPSQSVRDNTDLKRPSLKPSKRE